MSENEKVFAFPFPFLIQVKNLQSALPVFFKEKNECLPLESYLMTAILTIENINISSEKKKGTENEVTSYPLAHYTG